jgi:hypothetical protein
MRHGNGGLEPHATILAASCLQENGRFEAMAESSVFNFRLNYIALDSKSIREIP